MDFCTRLLSVCSCMLTFTRAAPPPSFRCDLPRPAVGDLEEQCQQPYHQRAYLCDPGAILSKTETDVLHAVIERNFSSCEGAEFSEKYSVAILLLSQTVGHHGCQLPMDTAERYDKFATDLINAWTPLCDPDLVLAVLAASSGANFLVPIFRRRLQIWSSDEAMSKLIQFDDSRRTFRVILDYFASLTAAFAHVAPTEQLVGAAAPAAAKGRRSHIPTWALLLTAGLLALAAASVLVAHLLSSYRPRPSAAAGGAGVVGSGGFGAAAAAATTGARGQRGDLTLRNASKRWRAGFGGGMMGGHQSDLHRTDTFRRSTLMFRQFSRKKPANTAHLM